ncbi:non-ribosomal peptide synthetase [Solwaraspora sp. WMMD792]|uniref:non-ribosomal peptide synthetase n=1 Tax=Solwaraspora sp. WMMD792 TaxID=3016099 RepID=UPI002416794E|nr:non-ribosomal peptide synthetase [Solwaraspora sp. WMMD792]MDG4773090.1 non-ribosomal peptide synthetase [Solwaraspora sp. WMMD792]
MSDHDPPSPLAHHLFEKQAAAVAERPAIRDGGRTLSYGTLNEYGDRLAALLRAYGAKPEALVGICLPRGIDQVVAAVAALKSGAGYLPVDPQQPALRIRQTLSMAGPVAVVTSKHHAGDLDCPELAGVPIVELDGGVGTDELTPTPVPAVDAGPENLAYVVFTSGSTGTPKGVQIEHGSLASFIRCDIEEFELTASDTVALVASPGFDASVWDIWPTLAVGACLQTVEPATVLSPETLRDFIVDTGITVGFFTTAIAERLLRLSWPASCRLRLLLTGGEQLHVRPAPGLPFRLVNNYGPTETTVIVTSGPVRPAGEGVPRLPSIGRPLPDAHVYLLAEGLRPVAEDEAGEIFIGGPGVARGYLNRPDLTEERFLPDPFADLSGARMYRTGDLARRRADGSLDFLGRADDQVKIRGNRVEPGEVAAVLQEHPALGSAHVIAQSGDAAGDAFLIAYVTAADPADPPRTRELHRYLAERLPAALVPRHFVALDSLPITANGKVDRAALPPVTATRTDLPNPQAAPSTALQRRLAEIWREVLGVAEVGTTDSFFDLGGHSLQLADVHRRITRELAHELPLMALFEHHTIQALADHLTRSSEQPAAAKLREETRRVRNSPRQRALRRTAAQAMETPARPSAPVDGTGDGDGGRDGR